MQTTNNNLMDVSKIEAFLDGHTEIWQDYFLRRADVSLINKWLIQNGYPSVGEHAPARRSESLTKDCPLSPNLLHADSPTFFEREGSFKHQRSNSKKHLRHDFAKSKSRSVFRTCEPSMSVGSTLEARRSSLKGMRQYKSLPAASVGTMLSMLIESKVRLPRYTSKDEDFKRLLRQENERDFFLEIVKDISNDLDLRSLTNNIMTNLSILCEADHCALYMLEGPKGRQALVQRSNKLIKKNSREHAENGHSAKHQIGHGIVGYVAETGDTVNLAKAAEDSRYDQTVDQIGNGGTSSMLCTPLKNADDDVIGVAVASNKSRNGSVFTKDDEKLFQTYLTFCGIAIQNALVFDTYSREYERNKQLLEVVHDLFEQQTSVEGVISRMMHKAQSLHKCERCTVMLRNMANETEITFTKEFDLSRPPPLELGPGHIETRVPGYDRIAEIVVSSGETVNQEHESGDDSVPSSPITKEEPDHRSLLCKPIRNPDMQIIGVAKIINRVDGLPFDEYDDQLFEAFTIFCGLGINNCILYDQVRKSSVKQQVALEVLSYHAAVDEDAVKKMKLRRIATCQELRLMDPNFDDFSLSSDVMIDASIRIFIDLGLIDAFHIDYDTLCRWILTVRKNYRNVVYHNWRHAFNVCQVMFTLLKHLDFQSVFSKTECLALVVGCLCHDLDHRGTNNAFQQKSSSPLAQLYGTTATMEHHHFNHAVMILNSEGQNIFGHLDSDDYKQVMRLLKHAILATDLSIHMKVRADFSTLVDQEKVDSSLPGHRDMIHSMLMTCCDLATITKPWPVQKRAADLVMTEFFNQGDKERRDLKIQPMAIMDRTKRDELPRLQLGWIEAICLPLYKKLAQYDAKFEPMLKGVLNNKKEWELLDRRRKQSLPIKETGL